MTRLGSSLRPQKFSSKTIFRERASYLRKLKSRNHSDIGGKDTCTTAKSIQEAAQSLDSVSISRRSLLLLFSTTQSAITNARAEAQALDNKMVGAYLPKSNSEEGFFTFFAEENRTPALRAGALEQYGISLPAKWKEIPVSNAKSGNYCQPRCDEVIELFEY